MSEYVLGIDQSTQGTKVILVNSNGELMDVISKNHRQIVTREGWVEHDPEEIYSNLLELINVMLLKYNSIKDDIKVVGLCNQRETVVAWNRNSGRPLFNAVVWQCGRAQKITDRIIENKLGDVIKRKTGVPVSPFYSAAKISWLIEYVDEIREKKDSNKICFSTVDTWLIFKLCGGNPKTDFSNAARTQLFNIHDLSWDQEICDIFNIPLNSLPEVFPSDSIFGYTDFEGMLTNKIPIHAVLGDSNGAMYAQECHNKGDVKATYGTGSSVMMNIANDPILSDEGIVTSLGWYTNNKPTYVFEGNINYAGAVTQWLVDKVKLLDNASDAGTIANNAKDISGLYLIPAFTGLGAPYWKNDARAMIYGMDRNTGYAEIIRASEECIAYQIHDIIKIMEMEISEPIRELRDDGAPTRDKFLMQFQSDILNSDVKTSKITELSGFGAALMAGVGSGVMDKSSTLNKKFSIVYTPGMDNETRLNKIKGWKVALNLLLQE